MKKVTALTGLLILGVLLCWARFSVSATAPLGPGYIDDTAAPITLTGSWTTITSEYDYMGASRKSTNGNIQFEIWGGGFALYARKTATGGFANLSIDSENLGAVYFYAASTLYQQLIVEVTNLSYGPHLIEFFWMSGSIYIDAIHVYPPMSPPTEVYIIEVTAEVTVVVEFPEITPEPTAAWRTSWESGGDEQPVAFEYKADAGQVAMILFEAAGLFCLLLIAVLLIRLDRKQPWNP